jgi:hypothetical protein
MPLIKPLLENQILLAFKKLSTSGKSLEQAQKDLAKELANAIDIYIKSALITVPPGQLVSVATPTGPGAGSTVAPVIATIS